MSAPNLSSYAQQPPRRPSVDTDFNGAIAENKNGQRDTAGGVPGKTYIGADVWNNIARGVASHGRVTAHTIVTITFSGGNPQIGGITSALDAITMGSYPANHPFHIARHPAGDANGDIDLTWDATWPASSATLPASICGAEASQPIDGTLAMTTTQAITNGVRIRTRTAAPAGVDASVNVHIY